MPGFAGGRVPIGSASGATAGWSGGDVGGAGSSSAGPSGSFAGSPAVPAYQSGGTTGAVVGDLQQGMGLFNQANGIFGSGSSASGDTSGGAGGAGSAAGAADAAKGASTGNGSMLGGGGIKSNAMGAVGGALGLFSASQGQGGVGGALSGAMSGMQLGMAVGGPMGAGIGAAAGAIIGGIGSEEKARVYWLKTTHPRIVADTLGYQQGTMDYTSAYGDMQSADADAKKALQAMGQNGGRYYSGTVHPAVLQAEGKLTAEQRAGRSNYTPGTAQYGLGLRLHSEYRNGRGARRRARHALRPERAHHARP